MTVFNKLDIINFLSKADFNNRRDLSEAKIYLKDKETTLYLLENINHLSNVSASKLFSLSSFTSDRDVAKLAINKDYNSFSCLPKDLFSNRNFMMSIANASRGHGIFYIGKDISDDTNLIKTYIREMFISEEFENFPKEFMYNPRLTKTYKKVLASVATNYLEKTALINYYRHKEYSFYDQAKAQNRTDILPSQKDYLDKLSNKLQHLSQVALEQIINESNLKEN